ncbi:hypothetical protein NKG05_29780 [Oerskovia sp. M15]
MGRWNLDLEDHDPALSLLGLTHAGAEAQGVVVELPRFDVGATEGGSSVLRGVPAIRVGGRLVTTVFDLLMAQYGVGRDGLPGAWPTGYDDAESPGPRVAGGPDRGAGRAVHPDRARVHAQRRGEQGQVDDHHGRGHQPLVPRGHHLPDVHRAPDPHRVPGVNGGGWAHYVGQEKARPVTGQQHMAFALDWQRPRATWRHGVLVHRDRPVAL